MLSLKTHILCSAGPRQCSQEFSQSFLSTVYAITLRNLAETEGCPICATSRCRQILLERHQQRLAKMPATYLCATVGLLHQWENVTSAQLPQERLARRLLRHCSRTVLLMTHETVDGTEQQYNLERAQSYFGMIKDMCMTV